MQNNISADDRRKICVVTGSRAEYGILYWLLKEIKDDPELKLQLLVTGMHLSPEYGETYHEIEHEFQIEKKIEMLLSSNSPTGVAKSIGLGIIGITDALLEMSPHILVVLGDRFEAFAAAVAAMCLGIPIAHIHGGEATEGLIDEAIRHAITKMSHLHFTATEEYRRRVIQLGEEPKRVFNFGAPGLDALKRMQFLSRQEIENRINWRFKHQNILITFHPVTLEYEKVHLQTNELLRALEDFPNLGLIFTGANADHGGALINAEIEKFCKKEKKRATFIKNMGRQLYLSTMKEVDVVVGNSSSGIIEAPSLKIPTVNIGDRQKGRIKARSVIDCEPKRDKIKMAIKKALSDSFRETLKNLTNPYGKGDASTRIKHILKSFPLKTDILMKNFFDIKN